MKPFDPTATPTIQILKNDQECLEIAELYKSYLPALMDEMELDDVCPILIDADIFGRDTYAFYSLNNVAVTVLPVNFVNYRESNIYKYYTQYSKFLDEHFALFVLAHELQHYKQHMTHRFNPVAAGYEWEGITYNFQDVQSIQYQKRPWEIDANNVAFEVVPKIINTSYTGAERDCIKDFIAA